MRLKLSFFRVPLFIIIIYLLYFSYASFTQFGLLSVVEPVSTEIKKTFSPERKTDELDSHLLREEKITARFKAPEDNLGILLVRFDKLSGIVTDKVIFRMKEEGEKKWYYENIYEAKQFQDSEYFTFGFPPFVNSKNKFYFFEIESLAGAYGNAIGFSKDKAQPAVVYKYSLSDFKNYETLKSFADKKFTYLTNSINNKLVAVIFVLSFLIFLPFERNKIGLAEVIRYLLSFKREPRKTFNSTIRSIRLNYFSREKKLFNIVKRISDKIATTKFYLIFLNTDTKKRYAIGFLIFLFALLYRFSSTLVNQHLFFYAGLGGQGDYDQFIRAATCALNFCSAILGQNFLFESTILGIFYKIFGFTEGLKAYLYLMIILSSLIAVIPHFLLSRKGWVSIGGIFGGLFLATSDFLTHMSLNFTPDNGSLFTFSLFFIVYLLTIQKFSIRWLLFFGFIGAIDALNKALFILNDLVALGIFVPVFFYEKVKENGKNLFRKINFKILLLSLLPLIIFLLIYIGWEYFVYIKYSAYYFLRGLIDTGGKNYIYYTSANDSSFLVGDILYKLFYLIMSIIIMIKRLIDHADFRIFHLAPIFLGLFFFSFSRQRFSIRKIIFISISLVITVLLLILVGNNSEVHKIFAGEYLPDTWTYKTYLKVFLFIQIIALFILNFGYSALKLSLPILPYVVMMIVLTKNSPFPRLHTHTVAWSIILLAYFINWISLNINNYPMLRRLLFVPVFLVLFIYFYIFPKTLMMLMQLNTGISLNQNQAMYLKWVEESVPLNTVILAGGGKTDIVTLAENVKRPIVYNVLWGEALMIKPKEIPGIKPKDFHILNELKINEIPGVKPTDFSIVRELRNKDNFRDKKYIILEEDIYIWRNRVIGIDDNLFSKGPDARLRGSDYSIKVYKFNPALKKAIYELNLRDLN